MKQAYCKLKLSAENADKKITAPTGNICDVQSGDFDFVCD